MSKILKFPDTDKIEETACAWIARLDAGDLSSAETQALKDWLRADERHQAALFEVAALFDQMSVVSTLNRLLPLSEVAMEPPAKSRRGSRLAALGLAASLVLGVVAFAALEMFHPPEYQTAIGEIRGVMMDDGSRVTINTDSRVSVHYRDSERRLVLDHGEAMFQVTHDETRPFVVEANGYNIRAVGTAFNVSLAGTEIEITVTEGIVEVSPASRLTDRLRGQTEGTGKPPKRRLLAGDQMKISASVTTTRSIAPAEVDAALSWRQGELVFRGESLEHVVAEVSRYSPVAITFGDDAIRDIPVGGVFETGDVDNLVDLLEHGFGVHAERTPDGNIELTRNVPSK